MERELNQLDKKSYLNDMAISPSRKEEMLREIKKSKNSPFNLYKRTAAGLTGVAGFLIFIVFTAGFLQDSPLNQFSQSEKQTLNTIHFNKQYQSLIGLPKKAIIRGRSTLPEGTVLFVKVYESKKFDKTIEIEKAIINADGSYSVLLDREIPERDYYLTLELLPHKQNKEVKEMIGDHGINLKYSTWIDGLVDYYHEGELFNGIRMYGKIYANDEWTEGQKTWLEDDLENLE
ncbi:hypothetical protein D3H55_16920 [Bacillus salacetis]|uniref:Uncharacterized protein n=1 Tax=Bacillus salacetis TaxID=2315464 RepID=A0A3A1QSR3_9BACI|nr:hypothetical protein [Bacillus salacetis]RIW30416.1 hypothetical protein D3H55_16920 [Bacillus salacetis]